MGLADFQMCQQRSSRFIVTYTWMVKIMTLKNVKVCCKAWYIIRVVYKVAFYRFECYSSQGQWSWIHGSSNTKKLKEDTCQVATTFSTILFPLINVMPQNTRMLPSEKKFLQVVFPIGTKWENILVDVNVVGQKVSYGLNFFFSLSWVSSRINNLRSILRRDMATSFHVVLLVNNKKGFETVVWMAWSHTLDFKGNTLSMSTTKRHTIKTTSRILHFL